MMATKREASSKKAVRPKVAAAKSELTDGAVMAVLESVRSEAIFAANIDPEVRRKLVAAEAYFLAERRGFTGGNELEDWVAAEVVVDARLNPMQVA